MSRVHLKKAWSYLPAWGALLLGFGTLIGDARADRAELRQPRGPAEPSSRSAPKAAEVAVRIEGETIYVSQDGNTFEELQLGDTPEAAHLRKLLRDEGADRALVTIPVNSMIVASGGGGASGTKPRSTRSTKSGNDK